MCYSIAELEVSALPELPDLQAKLFIQQLSVKHKENRGLTGAVQSSG